MMENESKRPPLGSFKKGDIVWARAFPYTWQPGWIETIEGSSALVSFYGCAMSRRFAVARILGFEENYARISKMTRVKLSHEISLALKELSRRMVVGLMCSCRNLAKEASGVPVEHISEERIGFSPTEMLGFVLDMAVCAWVGVEETLRRVRMSAQISAYRDSASASRNNEVAANVAKAVSVCPNGVDWQTMELESSLPSNESEVVQQDMFDSSSESEVGVTSELEDDFSDNAQVEDFEVFKEQVPKGREICVINTVDFSLLEQDEDFQSLMDIQFEAIPDCSKSTLADTHINEGLMMQNSVAGSSLEEVDVETICNRSCSPARDVSQTMHNEHGILFNKLCMVLPCYDAIRMQETGANCELADFVDRSGKGVANDGMPVTSLETERVKTDDEITIHFGEKGNDNAALPHQTADVVSRIPIDEQCIGLSPCYSAIDLQDKVSEFTEAEYGAKSGNAVAYGSVLMTSLEMEKLKQEDDITFHIEQESHNSAAVPDDTADSVSGILVTEQCVDSLPCCHADNLQDDIADFIGTNHIAQSVKDVAHDNIPVTSSETEKVKQQNDSFANIEHTTNDSAAISGSSNDSLLQNAPCMEGQLVSSIPKKLIGNYVDEFLKIDAGVQSRTTYNLVVNNDANPSSTLNIISSLTFPATVWEHNLQKRRLDQPVTSENLHKLRRTLNASSNVSEKAQLLVNTDNDVRFTSVGNSRSASYSNDKKVDAMKRFCTLNLLKDVAAKKHAHRKRGPHQCDQNWTRFYASPLSRDSSNSTPKFLKSSVCDKNSNSTKTLHMKFPKDFNLPLVGELEKKFGRFGPLDCSRTKISFDTGLAQVVFLHPADADAAYKYAKKHNLFGRASVRFSFADHDNYRKGHKPHDLPAPMGLRCGIVVGSRSSGVEVESRSPWTVALDTSNCNSMIPCVLARDEVTAVANVEGALGTTTPERTDLLHRRNNTMSSGGDNKLPVPVVGCSPLSLNSCLKRADALKVSDKKTRKVRFEMET